MGLGATHHHRRLGTHHHVRSMAPYQRLVRVVLRVSGMSYDGVGAATILRHKFPGWARFVIAFAIILLGRLALTIEGRDTFLPNFH